MGVYQKAGVLYFSPFQKYTLADEVITIQKKRFVHLLQYIQKINRMIFSLLKKKKKKKKCRKQMVTKQFYILNVQVALKKQREVLSLLWH